MNKNLKCRNSGNFRRGVAIFALAITVTIPGFAVAQQTAPKPDSRVCGQLFNVMHEYLRLYGYCENTNVIQTYQPGSCNWRDPKDLPLDDLARAKYQTLDENFDQLGCRIDRRQNSLGRAVRDQGPTQGQSAWLCQNAYDRVNIRDMPTASGSNVIAALTEQTPVLVLARVYNPQGSHHYYKVRTTGGDTPGVEGYVYHVSVENDCRFSDESAASPLPVIEWVYANAPVGDTSDAKTSNQTVMETKPMDTKPMDTTTVAPASPPQQVAPAPVTSPSSVLTSAPDHTGDGGWKKCNFWSSGTASADNAIDALVEAHAANDANGMLNAIADLCAIDPDLVDGDVLYLEAKASLESADFTSARGAWRAAKSAMTAESIFKDDLNDLDRLINATHAANLKETLDRLEAEREELRRAAEAAEARRKAIQDQHQQYEWDQRIRLGNNPYDCGPHNWEPKILRACELLEQRDAARRVAANLYADLREISAEIEQRKADLAQVEAR